MNKIIVACATIIVAVGAGPVWLYKYWRKRDRDKISSSADEASSILQRKENKCNKIN